MANYIIDENSTTTGISNVINYRFLIFNLLPVRYRKNKLFSILSVISSQLYKFWTYNFRSYRLNTLLLMRINGQKIILQKYLNDYFQSTGIYIINNFNNINFIFLYKISENNPIYLFKQNEILETPVYFNRKEETFSTFSFTVYIPSAVIAIYPQYQIEYIVNKYKDASMTYNVVII